MDVGDYIGIPFLEHGRDRRGLDCWGLLRLIYLEQLDIVLPSYSERYESAEDGKKLRDLVLNVIGPEWETAADPEPGDAALFRIAGEPMHVGVVIGKGEMIHVMKGIDVTIERFTGWQWKHRLAGFYRLKDKTK